MKENLIKGLLWFFGLVSVIRGLTLLGESFLGGVFMTLSGIALLPATHQKVRQLANKNISAKWFLLVWFCMAIVAGGTLQRAERKAIEDGTASAELISQDKERRQYQENERLKQEQIDAKKFADKEEREQSSYSSLPSVNETVVRDFNACRHSAISAKLQLAGTQYKSKVIMDSPDGYIVRICTNDGSVLITCGAADGKMITSKSSICSLDF